jgi:hypothetical protein
MTHVLHQPQLTGIRLESLTTRNDYASTAFWDEAEKPLRRNTLSDTLVLLDCCYTSTADLRGRYEESRTYQSLAASSLEGYTPGPGEKSFTTALCDSLQELLVESKGKSFSVIKLSERINTKRTHQSAVMWNCLQRYKQSVELGRLVRNPERESSFQKEIPEKASLLLRFSLGNDELSDAVIDRLARQLPEACEEARVHVRRIEWVKMEHRNPKEVFRKAVQHTLRMNRRQSTSNSGKLQQRRIPPELKKRTRSKILTVSAASSPEQLSQVSLVDHSTALTLTTQEKSSHSPETSRSNTAELVPSKRSEVLPESQGSEVTSELEDDSLFECSEDSSSMQSKQALSTEIGPLRNLYVEQLVQHFVSTRPSGADDGQSNRNEADHHQKKRKGKHRATSPTNQETDHSRPSKRSRRRRNAHSNNEDVESNEEADKNDPISKKDDAKSILGDERVFACPFVKRFPGRYFKCYGHVLKDVPRVKFHLSRDKVHLLPIYCPICSATFANEDLRDEHVRAATCPRSPVIQWEGITSSQRQLLKRRSPSANTPEANWYAVFRILFPDQPPPHSPYIDLSLSGELGLFREHMHTHGSRIWNSILESRLPEELQPHLEALQSMSDQFFPDAVERLCQSWTSRTSSTVSPSSDPEFRGPDTSHLNPDRDRFQTALAGNNGLPTFQFDDTHSNVIDRMMGDFSNAEIEASGHDWTAHVQTDWADPAWEDDMSLYAPNLDLQD